MIIKVKILAFREKCMSTETMYEYGDVHVMSKTCNMFGYPIVR